MKEFSSASHIELAMKSQRAVSGDEKLWEREWKTIEMFCNELRSSIRAGSFVLDVGCGGRELSWDAKKRGLEYRGLHISDGNFETDPFPIGDESVERQSDFLLLFWPGGFSPPLEVANDCLHHEWEK